MNVNDEGFRTDLGLRTDFRGLSLGLMFHSFDFGLNP